MCGIVAYLGSAQAKEVMLAGLARLEYRGYDSAGIAVMQGSEVASAAPKAPAPEPARNGGEMKRARTAGAGAAHLKVVKSAGKVANLKVACGDGAACDGTLGIAHTRWATHGPPTDANAHPHVSSDGTLAVVHNGIVENYKALRSELTRKGYVLVSETDTELLAHLIADVRATRPMPLDEAVRQALSQVDGAFGIAVLSSDEPDLLVGARRGSPLILGIGDGDLVGEFLLASDAAAVVERTRKVAYLGDGELVVVRRGEGYQIKSLDNVLLIREVQELQMSLHEIQKGSYKHFMLKEICEQPEVLINCMRGRMLDSDVNMGGLARYIPRIAAAPRIIIVACGTSWHAGLLGEYLLEMLARCAAVVVADGVADVVAAAGVTLAVVVVQDTRGGRVRLRVPLPPAGPLRYRRGHRALPGTTTPPTTCG